MGVLAAIVAAELVSDDADVAEVMDTGQETVQGIELVNGRFVAMLADAKTGAWVPICGFGCAFGPCGFRTLSITCMTPFAIRISDMRSCAELT